MSLTPHRIVADLGNSRLKWGRLQADCTLGDRASLPLDDPDSWQGIFREWDLSAEDSWAISTVNPPAAAALSRFLMDRNIHRIRWFRSAADVPISHQLIHPEKAGADRALAALAAIDLRPSASAGLVVSCGTAVTVERITAEAAWQGGAIAPGLSASARALNRGTAQLPRIEIDPAPPPWGNSTEPAIAAGTFWGTVGAVRELIARQQDSPRAWTFWTGGDAPWLAPHVEGETARVVPEMVLIGLTLCGFSEPSE